MQWIFKNKELDKNYDFKNNVGFIYCITNVFTGEKYIGKKLAITIKKLPPLKGKKNKRHKKVQTNWLNYYGSSEYLLNDIKKYGKYMFIREILFFAKNKQELNYYELVTQIKLNVLDARFKDGTKKYYNKNISRIFYPTTTFNSDREHVYNRLSGLVDIRS